MASKYSTLNGVSYGRVSTFDQAYHADGSVKEDASPQMQKLRCQYFVDGLNHRSDRQGNYHLLEHISDDGFSGKNVQRPGYKKLWNYITSGKIKFIVASELSRLSRNTYDFLDLLTHCEKHGVELFIIGLNLETSSPMGRAMVTILVALAQFEREMTSKRVRDNAQARLLNDGKINGACEILGLDRDPEKKGHFIINKNEVETLKEIFEIYLSSSSRAETFRILKERGFKNKHGQDFTKQKFNMLFSAVKYRYRGLWPMNDKNEGSTIVKLPHGPVLDESLLDSIEGRLARQLERKRRAGKAHVYLLTTLLEHEDGTKFFGHPAKKREYRYYYNKNNSLRIRCDELDELVIKRLNEYLSFDDSFMGLVQKALSQKNEIVPKIKERIKELDKQLMAINKEDSVIKDKLLETDKEIVLTWLEEQMEKSSNQRKIIESELGSLKVTLDQFSTPIQMNQLKDSLKAFLGQFKKLPNQSKRGYLERLFNKIVIKPNNSIELHIFEDVFKGNLGKNITTSSTREINGGTNRT